MTDLDKKVKEWAERLGWHFISSIGRNGEFTKQLIYGGTTSTDSGTDYGQLPFSIARQLYQDRERYAEIRELEARIDLLSGIRRRYSDDKNFTIVVDERIRPKPDEPGFAGTVSELIEFYEQRLAELKGEKMIKLTYTVNVSCSNCGVNYEATIAKGQIISSEICKNCGCQTLELLPSISNYPYRRNTPYMEDGEKNWFRELPAYGKESGSIQ